jgi:hypothetical protein
MSLVDQQRLRAIFVGLVWRLKNVDEIAAQNLEDFEIILFFFEICKNFTIIQEASVIIQSPI